MNRQKLPDFMKKHPIHQNLNTSFVDVSALVKYLSGLQFVGNIRIELSSYEAEIIFMPSREVRGREYDHLAGRISEGDAALERILQRASGSCGRIHVFEAAGGNLVSEAFLDDAIAASAMRMVSEQTDRPLPIPMKGTGAALVTTADWIALLETTAELLRTIDTSLEKKGLNFAAAFRNACNSLGDRYPFLAESFTYRHGSVMMRERVDPAIFVRAIEEALVCVFGRLRAQPRFSAVLKYTLHRLIILSDRHKKLYDRLSMTRVVDRLIRP